MPIQAFAANLDEDNPAGSAIIEYYYSGPESTTKPPEETTTPEEMPTPSTGINSASIFITSGIALALSATVIALTLKNRK